MLQYLRALVIVASLVAWPAAAQRGQTLDPSKVEFVLGNLEFSLIHELAHIAIRELEIPILGSEEQAADYIAAMSLINPIESPPGGNIGWLRFALSTADAFEILWGLAAETSNEFPYWDTHALSIQRFYAITCLIYGSDSDRFASLPERVQMPIERAAACPGEYDRAKVSMTWLRGFAEQRHAGPQQGEFAVEYQQPPSRTSEQLVSTIKEQGLVDWTAQRFMELAGIPGDIRLVFRSCGMPEAAWLPASRELVMCYELLDYLYALSPLETRNGERINSLLQ